MAPVSLRLLGGLSVIVCRQCLACIKCFIKWLLMTSFFFFLVFTFPNFWYCHEIWNSVTIWNLVTLKDFEPVLILIGMSLCLIFLLPDLLRVSADLGICVGRGGTAVEGPATHGMARNTVWWQSGKPVCQELCHVAFIGMHLEKSPEIFTDYLRLVLESCSVRLVFSEVRVAWLWHFGEGSPLTWFSAFASPSLLLFIVH